MTAREKAAVEAFNIVRREAALAAAAYERGEDAAGDAHSDMVRDALAAAKRGGYFGTFSLLAHRWSRR